MHPRTYGAFPRKIHDFVFDRKIVSLPFAIRGMTSPAASFFGLAERGLIAEGYFADVTVLDESRIADRATYEDPHRYSERIVHVLVNGCSPSEREGPRASSPDVLCRVLR